MAEKTAKNFRGLLFLPHSVCLSISFCLYLCLSVCLLGNAREPRSTGELAELVLEPDAVRMNALIIRERILGALHPDTAYYVRYRGAVYADSGDFARCIVLWTHAVDMQRTYLDPLSVATQVQSLMVSQSVLLLAHKLRATGLSSVSV